MPNIHEVADGVWVGPCPSTPEFIRSLSREYGVKSLVTVQTDDDLAGVGMDWGLMWSFLMTNSISPTRKPIVDFDDDALARGLQGAVDAVQRARAAGRVVYLHCTAGVNRSPSVAIAWLVAHQGLSLDEAWTQVTSRRRCDPNRRALERWQAARA